jgi:hypothetical protein
MKRRCPALLGKSTLSNEAKCFLKSEAAFKFSAAWDADSFVVVGVTPMAASARKHVLRATAG